MLPPPPPSPFSTPDILSEALEASSLPLRVSALRAAAHGRLNNSAAPRRVQRLQDRGGLGPEGQEADGGRDQENFRTQRKREGCLNLEKLLLSCGLPSLQQPSLLTGPTSWWATPVSNPRLQREPPPEHLHSGKPNKVPAALGTGGGGKFPALPGWRGPDLEPGSRSAGAGQGKLGARAWISGANNRHGGGGEQTKGAEVC